MDRASDQPLAWTVTLALLVVIVIEGILWTLTRVFILNFDVAGPNATALLVVFLSTGWSLWAVAVLPLDGRRAYVAGAALAPAGFCLSLVRPPLVAGIGAVVLVTAVTPPLAGLVATLRDRAVTGVALGILLTVALRVALGTAAPYATLPGRVLLGAVVVVAAGLLVALAVRESLPATAWGALGTPPAVVGAVLVVAAGYLAHPQAVARWALRPYWAAVLALVAGVLAGLAVLHLRETPTGPVLGAWVVAFLGSVAVVLVGSHPATMAALAVAWAATLVLVAAGCRPASERSGALALTGVQLLAVLVLALTVAATHWAFFPAPLDATRGLGTPLTLALHAVVPLAVGLALWRGGDRPATPVRQSRRSALAALAAGIAPLATLAATRTDPTSPAGGSDSIRVLTYNVHLFLAGDDAGQYSLSNVREVIADADPDIVALQESDGLRPLPGYVDGVRWLGRELGYHAAFGAASRQRSYGASLLSRWPIADTRVVELPISRSLTRIALVATVETPGGPLPVVSTHFMVEKEGDTRAAQAETVIEAVADHDRALVLGDFNITPDEPEYEILADAFTDAWRVADRTRGSGATADLPNPTSRIDYAFLKGEWTVHEAATVGDAAASDHRAFVADVEPR
jgi:endonuclease/exonuclease/phosphatase family metal-dependent hydrolase